jgi:hypothetical protein
MWINISSYSNAKYQIHGYIDVINIPSDIEVKSVKPEKVSIVLEEGKYIKPIRINKHLQFMSMVRS